MMAVLKTNDFPRLPDNSTNWRWDFPLI